MICVFVNRLFQTNGLHSNRNCVLPELVNLATSIVVFFIAHSFHTHQYLYRYFYVNRKHGFNKLNMKDYAI